MKPFWFAFNITDWLASKSVRMMSLTERGAYIGLLATAWGEDVPGTLPVDTDEVRRLAEMSPEQWAISGPCLLKKFPVSACGTYRYNPRLLADGQEQRRKSDLAAEAGRRSAEAKKQRKGNGTSTDVAKKPTDVEKTATECQLVTTTDTIPTNVGKQARQPEPSKPKPVERRLPLPIEDRDVFKAEDWPGLNDPARFAKICAQHGYPQVDFARYQPRIIASLEGKELPPGSLRNWIKTYLDNDAAADKLLLARPQVPNEIPSNYHAAAPYVAPIGDRIPDMSTIMNPNWKPPQA